MKSSVKCVKCGDNATRIVEEVGVKIPLCNIHYEEFIEEEDGFIDNVVILEEEE